MLRTSSSPTPRSFSGVVSSSTSPGGDVNWRDVVLLLLARMDARWLARAAVRTALARFVGRGLALSMRVLRVRAADVSGGLGSGSGVSDGGGPSRGESEGAVAVVAAAPDVGMAGGEYLSSTSLLLSSRLLILLARSRLLLPECCALVATLAAELPLVAVG